MQIEDWFSFRKCLSLWTLQLSKNFIPNLITSYNQKKRRPLLCWFSSTAASAFRIIQFWKLQSANHTIFLRNFCWFALLQLHTISGIGKPAKPGNFQMHTATSARVFRNTLLNQINCFCCIPRIWMSALWWFCLWKWLIHRCMSHFVVETVGIEPMTSWLPVKRSPESSGKHPQMSGWTFGHHRRPLT